MNRAEDGSGDMGPPGSTLASFPPGSPAKAVVCLEGVEDKDLKGLLLERQSDTVYLLLTDRTLDELSTDSIDLCSDGNDNPECLGSLLQGLYPRLGATIL